MKEVVEVDGLKLQVIALTDESAAKVARNPNGPEIVPDMNAAVEGWEQ